MSRSRRVPAGTSADPVLGRAANRWQNLVVGLDHLDPITVEVVRLRAAKHHDCRT